MQRSRRHLAALLGAVVAVTLPAGCSEGDDSAACDTFRDIATEIESDGPGADVGDDLDRIRSQAADDGEGDVEAAARAFQRAAQDGSEAEWYEALGRMEAACA